MSYEVHDWEAHEAIALAYAKANPDGFTIDELAFTLGTPRLNVAYHTVHRLRRTLATDSMNIINEPQGKGERYLYRLVDTQEDSDAWVGRQMRHLETSVTTVHSIAESIVNATSGRTKAGKIARATLLHLGRLLEDIQLIRQQQEQE